MTICFHGGNYVIFINDKYTDYLKKILNITRYLLIDNSFCVSLGLIFTIFILTDSHISFVKTDLSMISIEIIQKKF